MPRYFIRSTLYNLCFYGLTAFACILCLPTLFMPRRAFMTVVHAFVFTNHILERTILGLDFEVRGRENLPAGACIIAAKHQSAYETTKIHILLDDPAIILKKELLKIPLWGRYLAKSDVIAIDRSTPKAAIESIQAGARRVMLQNRQIVIFPQGTRVAPHVKAKDRPYKIGVVRIQEATNLPIIPLAMNSGVFWPRNSWTKKPGRVVFEFLPPVMQRDNPSQTLSDLQEKLESRSNMLMEEALYQQTPKNPSGGKKLFTFLSALLFLAYTTNWFIVANLVENGLKEQIENWETQGIIRFTERPSPTVTGFPGKMNLAFKDIEAQTSAGKIHISNLRASAWPFPRMAIAIEANNTKIFGQPHWLAPIEFQKVTASIRPWSNSFTLLESRITGDKLILHATGQANFENADDPRHVLNMELENEGFFLQTLAENKIIEQQGAAILSGMLMSMKREGVTKITLHARGGEVYFGKFKLFDIKDYKKN